MERARGAVGATARNWHDVVIEPNFARRPCDALAEQMSEREAIDDRSRRATAWIPVRSNNWLKVVLEGHYDGWTPGHLYSARPPELSWYALVTTYLVH